MLENLEPPKKITPCKVREVAETLDSKDREIFMKAINSPDQWPTKTLSRELNSRGLAISDTPIAKHRLKGCSCA